MKTADKNYSADRVKILLVDDLKNNLMALEGLLRRDDVEIFKAKSGTEALEFMMVQEFALALVDVQMPVMSGFELAELMRGTKKTRHIPIIFVTATAKDQSFLFKGYESGAVDFLLKPLDTFAVKSKVNIFIELYQQKKELKKQEVHLQQINEDLEKRVQERTLDLVQSNQNLQAEISERKRMEKEILEIPLQEQRRFGSQLHDGLCQELAGIEMLHNSLTQKAEKNSPFDISEFKNIESLIHKAVDQARDTARGLYPGDMESASFVYSLEELSARTQQHLGILCQVFCPETIQIDNQTATHLYRIAQEGLANAVKHGQAKNIEISFTQNADKMTFSVKDDGQGIAPDLDRKKGIGLNIMKYRAHMMDATFDVEPNLPQGVVLKFVFDAPVS
ncbi:MAG: response regulator receiver sensor signal transduction histidine kinase [uncultured bacterium]|nr:MAG: response regulator receiver sensor signal transduction histidine kinase [uncultured bacterium]